ncbi:MAG: MBL fold metallo-hydrolase [Acidobacteriaceae bacterium]
MDDAPGTVTLTPEVSGGVEHFRNGRFFNPGVRDHGFRELLRWISTRKIGRWRKWIDSTPGPRPPDAVEGEALRATLVNHSTVLLQTDRYNILTDPVWSRRASPVGFAGPNRHRDPGIRFEDLPELHCLLISHNHYDHFDAPTLRRIAARHRPVVFCPLGLGLALRRLGFGDVRELDWWQSDSLGRMRANCVPAQHFSARGPFDRNRTLWCGWTLETRGGRIYFAGDTGFGSLFAAIRERFPALRLALLPIGAYEPEWFMGPVHMTPEQAVEAWQILGARKAMAIHFGTFALADDGEREPADRLREALRGHLEAQRFWIPVEGEGRAME